MPLQVTYTVRDGITVPYPPLFDAIRTNHGFIDTRGRPDKVDAIPESARSEALRALLLGLAAQDAPFLSLGCDLGEHKVPKLRLTSRWVAGGYVQLMAADRTDQGVPLLRQAARMVEAKLRDVVGQDRWKLELALTPVLLKLAGEITVQSMWIWFHAHASTIKGAMESRERLLHAAAVALLPKLPSTEQSPARV